MPHATTLSPSAIRIVRRPIGEASSSIVSRSSFLATAALLPAGAWPLLRVGDRCEDDEHEDPEQDDAADRDPRHPRGATDEGERQDQRGDEREHVARAVAKNRAEGAAGGDLGGGREPPGPEQVADPKGKDVVRPEPAEHERVEAAHGELERPGNAAASAPPARCRRTGSPPLRAARARRRRPAARARRRRDRRRGRRARGRTPTMQVRSRAARRAASACREPFAAQAFAAQTRGIE